MWSLKFTVKNQDSIYTVLTKKYAVTDYFYPLDVYRRGNHFHILGTHILEGDEAEKKQFTHALKNHPKTVQCEHNNNLLLVLIKEEEEFYNIIYNPALYHPAPAIAKDGIETWHIASYDREALQKIISEIKKWKTLFSDFTLLGLTRTNLSEIYFPRVLPKLPPQQKKAFQLAISSGYYHVPRKVYLDKLASLMGVSPATYQEHLRKAEQKLLPFFAENVR